MIIRLIVLLGLLVLTAVVFIIVLRRMEENTTVVEEKVKEKAPILQKEEVKEEKISWFTRFFGGVKTAGSGVSEVSNRIMSTIALVAFVVLIVSAVLSSQEQEALLKLKEYGVTKPLITFAIMASLGALGVSGVFLALRKKYFRAFIVLLATVWFAIGFMGMLDTVAVSDADTVTAEASSYGNTKSAQGKTVWQYGQKRHSSDDWEYDYDGREYKVKDLKHIPGKEISFDVYWGIGHGIFRGDIGSSETGTYHNILTGEEGRFEGLEWTGKTFTMARMICEKNCAETGYLFKLEKK